MVARKLKGGILAGAVVAGIAAMFFVLVWLVGAENENRRHMVRLEGQTEHLARVNQEAQERVVELPNDGQAYYVTICLHDDWRRRPKERALVAWWDMETRLRSIKGQVFWRIYPTSDEWYRVKLAPVVPVVPAVLVQSEDGQVQGKWSGDNLPTSATDMGDRVAAIWKNRPFLCPWNCPKPAPVPSPTPAPNPDDSRLVPVPGPIPDTVAPAEEGFPVVTLVLVVVAAALVTLVASVALQLHREVRSKM